MNIAKQLLSGSILRNLEFFVMVAITFIMSPYIVHSLGERMYGFWVLIGTFLGYYGLLDFGLSSAVSRFVSKAVGKEEKSEVNEIVSTGLVVFSLIGVFAIGITCVLYFASSFWIRSPEELAIFRKLIALIGLSFAIGFPVRIYTGIFTAYLRYDILSKTSIIKMVVMNIFIFISLGQGYGIMAVGIINFFANMVQYISYFILCRKKYPEIKITIGLFRKAKFKMMFNYSAHSFIIQIADIFRFKLDTLIVASVLGVASVTYYSIGARLAAYFTQFMTSCMNILMPVFSRYEGAGDFDSIRYYFLKATIICNALSVYVGMSLMFYGEVFIERWMGEGFLSSYYVSVLLILPLIVALIQLPSIGLLYGVSKHYFYSIANSCEGILNLIMSLVFVNYFGIYGVALGTALSMIVVKMFVQPIYVCKIVNIPLKSYFFRSLFPTTMKTALPLMVYFFLVQEYLAPDYTVLILLVTVQTFICVPIMWFSVLDKNDRQSLKKILITLGKR